MRWGSLGGGNPRDRHCRLTTRCRFRGYRTLTCSAPWRQDCSRRETPAGLPPPPLHHKPREAKRPADTPGTLTIGRAARAMRDPWQRENLGLRCGHATRPARRAAKSCAPPRVRSCRTCRKQTATVPPHHELPKCRPGKPCPERAGVPGTCRISKDSITSGAQRYSAVPGNTREPVTARLTLAAFLRASAPAGHAAASVSLTRIPSRSATTPSARQRWSGTVTPGGGRRCAVLEA